MQTTRSHSVPAPSIAALPRLRFFPNWSVKSIGPRQYVVVGAGHLIDEIAQWFVADLHAQGLPSLAVGQVWESTSVPGVTLALRVRNSEQEIHFAATDVTLRRQGADLFVRFGTSARTGLTHLRRLVFGTAIFAGWALLYAGFLAVADVYGAIVQEYVRKYNPQDIVAFAEAIKAGYRIDEQGKLVWPGPGGGIGIIEMLRADPKLMLTQVAGPPAIIAGALVAGLMLIPRSLFFFPCRAMGWPMPEEFDAFVEAHAGWVESMFSYVLQERYGIGEDRVIRR